ncbi:MAG: hypothetical protein QOG51_250 [Verrucomicrobiota bacterium]
MVTNSSARRIAFSPLAKSGPAISPRKTGFQAWWVCLVRLPCCGDKIGGCRTRQASNAARSF